MGRNVQRGKWQIVQRAGEKVVGEFEGEQPVKCEIIGESVYYLTAEKFRIFKVAYGQNEEAKMVEKVIVLEKPASDFYVSGDVVYLLCGLELYGY